MMPESLQMTLLRELAKVDNQSLTMLQLSSQQLRKSSTLLMLELKILPQRWTRHKSPWTSLQVRTLWLPRNPSNLKEPRRTFKLTVSSFSQLLISLDLSHQHCLQLKMLLPRLKRLLPIKERVKQIFMLKLRLSKRKPRKLLQQEKLSSRDRRISSWRWQLLLRKRLKKKKERDWKPLSKLK